MSEYRTTVRNKYTLLFGAWERDGSGADFVEDFTSRQDAEFRAMEIAGYCTELQLSFISTIKSVEIFIGVHHP